MAQKVIDDEVRDTNTYTKTHSKRNSSIETLLQFVNDLDVDVKVTWYGTHFNDNDGNDKVELGTKTGVNKVATNNNEYNELNDCWDRVIIEYTANSTPSSGSFKVYVMNNLK